MANYKRKKCRYCGKGRVNSQTFYRKRHRLKPIKIDWRDSSEPEWRHFSMMRNSPRYWSILYHVRPHRIRTRRCEIKIMQGYDPDDMTWPIYGKPHIYCW